MFKLKFYIDDEKEQVSAVAIDDGSFNTAEMARLKDSLSFLQVQNPCIDFSRKMRAGDFENLSQKTLNDLAYMCDNLNDCWAYGNAPLMNNGKSDIRPYIGVINLLQNIINLALQSRRRLDEYRDVFGELPSDIFGES